MRIATANAFDSGVDTLQQRQSELAKLQEQMTSGQARRARQRRPGRRGARRAGAGQRRSAR